MLIGASEQSNPTAEALLAMRLSVKLTSSAFKYEIISHPAC